MPQIALPDSILIGRANPLGRKKGGEQVEMACFRFVQTGQQTIYRLQRITRRDAEPRVPMPGMHLAGKMSYCFQGSYNGRAYRDHPATVLVGEVNLLSRRITDKVFFL